jgi:hypothetical protein
MILFRIALPRGLFSGVSMSAASVARQGCHCIQQKRRFAVYPNEKKLISEKQISGTTWIPRASQGANHGSS